jgi:hypothetical protein
VLEVRIANCYTLSQFDTDILCSIHFYHRRWRYHGYMVDQEAQELQEGIWEGLSETSEGHDSIHFVTSWASEGVR